jgi:hypothetical protein
MQFEDMRTVSALRSKAPAADAAARLSDRALRAAAQNPDHSPEGRAAAEAVLRARGLSIDPWGPTVRSFLKPRNLARGGALFFGAWARVRRLFGAAAILGFAGLTALLGALALADRDIGGEPLRAGIAAATAGAALAWFALSVFRRKLARVTVIRPAHQRGAPLRRFIGRELRGYGHVVTMASGVGAGAVRSASGYRAAAARLRQRFLFNLRMLLSGGEGLALSADEAWRPHVLGLLARSSDALIVDLSDGASWAWDDLQRLDVVGRSVFIADWSRLEEAEATLRALGVDAPCFAYAPDGEVQRRGAFRAAVLRAMRAAHGMAA